jgi:hypothetical protein
MTEVIKAKDYVAYKVIHDENDKSLREAMRSLITGTARAAYGGA